MNYIQAEGESDGPSGVGVYIARWEPLGVISVA